MMNDFLISLHAWIEARTKLLYCYEQAELSPSYHCFGAAEYERKCRDAVEREFNKLVDARIKA